MLELDKIYCGNCLEVMKGIEDNSVDLLVSDPPYGIEINKMGFVNNINGGVAKRTNYKGKAEWDSSPITCEYFKEIFRVSKSQIIFGGNYYTDILPTTKSWIIWDKKTDDKYSNDFSDCEMAWTSLDIPTRIIRYLWHGMIQDDMKNKEIRYHPTQKPVKLFEKILTKYSKEGDLILDPFLGSGTTAVACVNLNRHYIGIELSPEYCEIARQRVNDAIEYKQHQPNDIFTQQNKTEDKPVTDDLF